MMPDGPAAVRSMALKLSPCPTARSGRTGMNKHPCLPAQGSAGRFYEQLLSSPARSQEPARPDPAAPEGVLSTLIRETAKGGWRSSRRIPSPPVSPMRPTMRSMLSCLSMRLAKTTPVRLVHGGSRCLRARTTKQFACRQELSVRRADRACARRRRRQWHLILAVGQPGDPTNDATLPWPADRPQVDAGTLSVDRIVAEADGNCRDINFDPLAVPAGNQTVGRSVAVQRDPPAYSVSFTRPRRRSERRQARSRCREVNDHEPALPAHVTYPALDHGGC